MLPRAGEDLFLTVVRTGSRLVTLADDPVEGGLLVCEPAGVDGRPVTSVPAGSAVHLSWSSPSGRHDLDTGLTAVLPGRPPMWHLAALGETRTVQLRRYVRAVDSIAAELVVGGERRAAWVADVSEGGARVLVADARGLSPEDDEPARLHLVVGETPLQLSCRLLPFAEADIGRTELRVEFVDIGPAADVLRKHVFRRQLADLQAQRASSA